MISARAFRGAISFLTRVPSGTGEASSNEIATWVPFFPLVGALVGMVGALVYVGASELLSPLLAAALAVSAEVLVTGGFHEDGLGDTMDALGGATGAADARRILKDPRLGSFGVLSVTLGVIVRVAALATLDPWSAVAALPAAHALGRGAAISVLRSRNVAAGEGLGASYARAVSSRTLFAGVTASLALAAIAIGAWVLAAFLACAVIAWWMGRIARHRIGGVTGDVLGAIQQCSLLAVLLLASAVDAQHWTPLAWWR
ncbi:MAG: adenosylcobinamide-GDP ribazoletransferase [Actinomycetota bacterium]